MRQPPPDPSPAGHAYVDGVFVPAREARVSAFDRGFLMADGVYEVAAVLDGRLVDNDAHLDRLDRSLAALDLPSPVSRAALIAIEHELVARDGVREGLIYMQVTRGPAEREFAFPDTPRPTLVAFGQKKAILDSPAARAGIRAIAAPDIRWGRRDIKSIALLAQAMARQDARRAGADEAFLVEDGAITEGAASTVFAVTPAGELVTRPLSRAVLAGCTRARVLEGARAVGLPVSERALTVADVLAASECFIASATAFVTPVVALDGRPIGAGRPGPLAQRLRALYIEKVRAA